MPVQPWVMRPSRVTPVASTKPSASPPAAKRAWCWWCQSWTAPSTAEYWHIGESTTRLRSVRPRRVSGVNSAGIGMPGPIGLLGGLLDLAAALAVDRIHQHIDLLHHGFQLLHPRLAFLAQLLEGGERRAHVADRIAGGGAERLGVALV